MTEEDLNELRKNYYKRLEEQEKFKRIIALQKKEDVKSYMDVLNLEKVESFKDYLHSQGVNEKFPRIKTNSQLIVKFALDIQGRYYLDKNQHTNKIVIRMNNDSEDEKIWYKDIEKDAYDKISEKEKEEYESDKYMIYPEDFPEFKDLSTFDVYEKIFIEFYTKAIEEDQEKAKQYIIEKYVRKNRR